MPIKWTPELDSILLHGVFEECNISFSKALCGKLAERVGAPGGIECTPKAVENRLYSWKKKNVSGTASATSTPSKPAATPKKTSGRAKAGAAKKKAVTPPASTSDSENEPEGLAEEGTPSAARGKRGLSTPKRSYAESDADSGSEVEQEYVPLSKRVKTEPAEGTDIQYDDGLDEI